MFGPDLLVAPVAEYGARERLVRLVVSFVVLAAVGG